MKRKKTHAEKTMIYFVLVMALMMAGKSFGSTFIQCQSRDVKTCTKEVTKGEAIVALAKDPKAVFVKVDFVKLDTDKGTLKNDNK